MDGASLEQTGATIKHPYKPGKVTIPHPRRDLHPKALRSIYRQAGIKEPW
jgi:predicted RNA binding protein YcfA (HicA-like mRNA interferase family)